MGVVMDWLYPNDSVVPPLDDEDDDLELELI